MQEHQEQRKHENQLEIIRHNKWLSVSEIVSGALLWSVFWVMFFGSITYCLTN